MAGGRRRRPRRLDQRDYSDVTVSFRATLHERERWAAMAEEAGLSLSDLVREALARPREVIRPANWRRVLRHRIR
jgi:hypothetical protein